MCASADNSTVVTAARSAGSGTLQGTTVLTAVNGLVSYIGSVAQRGD
jgi:hypothetical protein